MCCGHTAFPVAKSRRILGGQFLLQFGDAPGAVDGAHGFHVPNHVLGYNSKEADLAMTAISGPALSNSEVN